MNCSTPGLPFHHQLPEFTQTHVHRVDDAIQTSHPLSSPSPSAPNLSQYQGLFQWVNSLYKYWSCSFSIRPSSEYSVLISFKINLYAVQRTLNSLLQDHNSKASILLQLAFFMIQLSHRYMRYGNSVCTTIFIDMSICLDRLHMSNGFLCGSPGKDSICNAGDLGSIPGFTW